MRAWLAEHVLYCGHLSDVSSARDLCGSAHEELAG
jgi:hypothetical protein